MRLKQKLVYCQATLLPTANATLIVDPYRLLPEFYYCK
jgi:hypothetical protein